MKQLSVKRLKADFLTAKAVPELFQKQAVDYHILNMVDWHDAFPYCPKVEFAIAHDGKNIFFHYKVEEQSVRAEAHEDLGRVWEDSCCEFFVSPDAEGGYYNLETNCIGTVLLCNGQGRENRQPAPKDVLESIDRWSSLGREFSGRKDETTAWELALVVPVTAFFNHKIEDFGGLKMKANFYKCGDKTKEPHFVSWNAIEISSPDFHRPDFFGEISFI